MTSSKVNRWWSGLLGLMLLLGFGIGGSSWHAGAAPPAATAATPERAATWGERLGWGADQRAVIFHAGDVGMCCGGNPAAQRALAQGEYRSASAMVPCPWFSEMAAWCVAHPDHDVGLHLTLTSEWKHYRWGPVAPRDQVKGLLDAWGCFHRDVVSVALSAKAEEVALELRAQLDRARKLGMKPSHLDTHMGTLYARLDYTKAYLELAEAEALPAMVIELTPHTIAKFGKQGYPISDDAKALLNNYRLPKLDDFHSIPSGKTYEEKREKFLEHLRTLPPGLHEIIFHPSVETEGLRRITNSWQQRVWEDRLFQDPVVRQFLKDSGIVVADWKEVMTRHAAR
ncbi:MAG TPA: polysaccharide deacetylase family protein [Gemmatales bacterium]|nr:polysaccharide deacetylase family protein [Gemmatales bacterium]